MVEVKERARLLLAAGLVFAGLFLAYGNHFRNDFHFDDAHTIVTNPAIRKLENIPNFFRDAKTFSVLPQNQSYRPLVSTLLAIDYRLGGGLKPIAFHVSIFLIFLVLLLLFAAVLYRLLQLGTDSGSEQLWWIVLLSAGLYGLHPANADTINYIIASADVLSTFGVIASFAVYFYFPRARPFQLFVLPAAIGILAKPPTAIFAVLFAIYLLLFPANGSTKGRMRRWLFAVVPPLVICAALVWFVQRMTPPSWIAGARSSHGYFLIQPYVAWRYLRAFFAPFDLSADYDVNPLDSGGGGAFWFGCIFVAAFLIATVALCWSRKTRLIGFGLAWFIIALLPTSLFPLAEVMNDHRTFIAYPGLVIALAALLVLLSGWAARVRFPRLLLPGIAAILLFGSACATFQRNKTWLSEETLWRDVTEKSPRNGRGLMNYGLTLMGKGDTNGALAYYQRALVFTPQYPYLFVNMAIAEDALGHSSRAEEYFREAVRLGPDLPDSYSFYARFLIRHSRQAEAGPLLRRAAQLSPADEMVRDLLAEASVFSADSYLNESLRLYREKRFEESITAARKALEVRPGYAEAWNNIGAACNDLGRFAEAAEACREAIRLKPDFTLAKNNLRYAEERMNQSGAR